MDSAQPVIRSEPEPIDLAARATANSVPPERAFALFDIFIDRDGGLRAIWGIVLFLLFREVLGYVAFPILEAIVPPMPGKGAAISPRLVFASEGAALLCVAGATFLMAQIERCPVSTYGFSPRRGAHYFLGGAIWGAVLLSLLVATLRATGLLAFDARLLVGRSALEYGFTWLAGFLLVGMAEEVLLRGYLQFTLTRGLSEIYAWLFGPTRADAAGFWTAATILSFIFGFGHRTNPGESPLGLLSAGAIGLVFCLTLWRTGSLWWAIGFHAAWDWAQSFLYGVADSGLIVRGRLFATHPVGKPILSGGLTGPEGSVFLYPVLAACLAAIVFTLPRPQMDCAPASAAQARLD